MVTMTVTITLFINTTIPMTTIITTNSSSICTTMVMSFPEPMSCYVFTAKLKAVSIPVAPTS